MLELINKLENLTGLPVKNTEIYHLALRHSSLSGKKTKLDNNERLEFLGDSVVNAWASLYLYQKFPNEREGNLSRIRSYLINTRTLAEIARELELDRYVLLSSGTEKGGGRENENILASTFEAVMGAFFLEHGWEKTGEILTHFFDRILGKVSRIEDVIDHKSRLQEVAQSDFKTRPTYVLVAENGPDHAKEFTVKVLINGVEYGRGKGRNKKEAQQKAAEEALRRLGKA